MARRLTLDFLRTETAAGTTLALAALAGLIVANSPWRNAYAAFLAAPVPVRIGGWAETLPVLAWVKDGLMTVFFYLVGLEIKFEALRGELSSPRRLALPVIAAAGGMIAPALVYLAVNAGSGGRPQGWPVPVATDIAFALAALAVAGRGAPTALRTFLMALAVADDLGAVVLIATLFTHTLRLSALAGAAASLGCLALLTLWRRAPAAFYLIGALAAWAFTLRSGVSPSVAGVAAAMFVPIAARRDGERGMLERISEALHPWVAYAVLPLFAFCAAGFSLAALSVRGVLSPVPLGIFAALLIGKPLGVFSAARLAVRLRLAHRPSGAGWGELFAVTVLCGVGFTMSLYLAALAFPAAGPTDGAETQAGVRLGVIAGSLASVAVGAWLLRRAAMRRDRARERPHPHHHRDDLETGR